MTFRIATLPPRKALSFLALFIVPATSQAILLTVVPVEALNLLGDARAVTLLYVAAGLLGVAGRFCVPVITRVIGRRMVFTLGTAALAAGAILMALNLLPALAVALVVNTFAFACIDITSQLYLLDHVPRAALRHFEPLRIFASAGPWSLGPWLGIHLQQHVTFAAPFAVSAGAALALLILFWSLRLGDREVLPATPVPVHPLGILRRFFVQPRLVLAWTLASTRSCWWSMFYVYVPIFAVTSGLGAEAGGIIASVGTAWVWMVPFWGWFGRRFGLRRLLLIGYSIAAGFTLCAAVSFATPWLGAVLLIVAAFGAGAIDGAGNLLFLRAVRTHERAAMTTVFASFRDVAQLGPPAVCSVLLTLFSLPSVFVASGAMMLGSAALTRCIPRRL